MTTFFFFFLHKPGLLFAHRFGFKTAREMEVMAL